MGVTFPLSGSENLYVNVSVSGTRSVCKHASISSPLQQVACFLPGTMQPEGAARRSSASVAGAGCARTTCSRNTGHTISSCACGNSPAATVRAYSEAVSGTWVGGHDSIHRPDGHLDSGQLGLWMDAFGSKRRPAQPQCIGCFNNLARGGSCVWPSPEAAQNLPDQVMIARS